MSPAARFERAVDEDLRLSVLDDGDVLVRNHSHDDPSEHEYRVEHEDGSVTGCNCPDAEWRGVVCKHQIAVIRARVDAENEAR